MKKKLTGKTDWYKQEGGKRKMEELAEERGDWEFSPSKRVRGADGNCQKKGQETQQLKPTPIPTTSVIFVEQTRRGGLAGGMRDMMSKMEGMLGYRFKVEENSGTALRTLLSSRDPWAGGQCERSECFTCNQASETKPDCFQTNIVYESLCTECNRDEQQDGGEETHTDTGDTEKGEQPSIYVGETARSLHERAGEHGKAADGGDIESHMVKHWSLHHEGGEQPPFRFDIVKRYQTALARQVGEAVRIEMRGSVLNSKSEFNRCRLTRLIVDESWKEGKKQEQEEEKAANERWEAAGAAGEDRMYTMDSKRTRETAEDDKGGRKKKLKYAVMEEDLGLVDMEEGTEETDVERRAAR